MEWLRQGIQRIKEVLGLGKIITSEKDQCQKVVQSYSSNTSDTNKNIERISNKDREPGILTYLRMRPRKDFKSRNRDGAKSAEEILRVKKPLVKTFKSPVVRPVRVKKGSTWMHRLLSSSSGTSASSTDQDILEYFRIATESDDEEADCKTYASRFINSEHYNFIGSDKNLGPLVISIKYPNISVGKSDNPTLNTDKKFSDKTFLILRLASGLTKRCWNRFQLSNPTLKSPMELVQLSFPDLVFTHGLLPVLCPDVSEIIAEYDDTCEKSKAGVKYGEVKTEREEKIETSSKMMKLKALQGKLITRTCKFLELSDWDFEAYENFFTIKKSTFPKYMSFSLPVTLKTPKMCSKLVRKAKSPNFLSLPKRTLKFEEEDVQIKPTELNFSNSDTECGSPEDFTCEDAEPGYKVENNPNESRAKEVFCTESDENDLEIKLKLINLKFEKEQMLETNSMLEKEKEVLIENEKRLMSELAAANTIIDTLKKKVET